MTSYIKSVDRNDRHIAIWLFCVCAFVFSMIVIGGITRLTESGLSMVNWHPIFGIIPPLNETDWMVEFNAYKQYPQYQKINVGMTLHEFKNIFFWEYSHRLFGRMIGVVYAVPFFVFLWQKNIKHALKPHLWTLLILGGCQGLLGWWMVKSGLVDRPDVSHYRLTAHLGLAVIVYIYMFNLALGLILPVSDKTKDRPLRLVRIFLILVFTQILLGGLVAGLNAGLVSNTWPLMMGQMVPDGMFFKDPWYMNFFDNEITTHFEHRITAYMVTIIGALLWWKLHTDKNPSVRLAVHLVMCSIILQVTLGILTVINMVPIPLAASHQAGAILLLSCALYLLNRVKS